MPLLLGQWLSALRRRKGLAALIVFAVPFALVILAQGPDLSAEQALVQRLAQLQARLQHLDLLHRQREEEVRVLAQHLGQMVAAESSNGSSQGGNSMANLAVSMTPEVRALLRNLTGFADSGGLNSDSPTPPRLLHLPSAYHFLPHLLTDPASLRPAYAYSRGRSGVTMVLGVPTVRRSVQSYLLGTLRNLVENIGTQDLNDTLIIVFIAETDRSYVLQVAKEIELHFSDVLASGLVEVISPPASYYPDLDRVPRTLGDAPARVRWRTKQNLDLAFLMAYAQPRGTFYVQLEDDILAKKDYVATMRQFALDRIVSHKPWFLIEFCQLGFIGKMFKCADLPVLVQFFLMFYNDKPCDWLLDNLLQTKQCRLDEDSKKCRKAKDKLWVHYKPSLFQHIGIHSSLPGKVQNLKDKHYGKASLYRSHKNPQARVSSTIKHYKQYTLQRAYQGESFFWGLLPEPGDHLDFQLIQPLCMKSFLFRSGNPENPADRFYNTTVEALSNSSIPSDIYQMTSDGYYIVGHFNSIGVAEGIIDQRLCPISALRLSVHGYSDNWAILSEILIIPMEESRSAVRVKRFANIFNSDSILDLRSSNGAESPLQ